MNEFVTLSIGAGIGMIGFFFGLWQIGREKRAIDQAQAERKRVVAAPEVVPSYWQGMTSTGDQKHILLGVTETQRPAYR